jgi:hypothetical protein
LIAHNGKEYRFAMIAFCFENSMMLGRRFCRIELLQETAGFSLKLSKDRSLGPESLGSLARFILQKRF